VATSSLDHSAVQAVLEREHKMAEGDEVKLAAARPKIDAAKAEGAGFDEISDLYPKDTYLAIEPDMGRFLYLTICSADARNIVEFGSSFGISTLYLAAGARETGGHVIGSEMRPAKVARARANLDEAGLSQHVDLREGDALETLADIEGPIDLLFLDGWKDLYLPVLQMMESKLKPGALVLADNIFTFPDDLKDYVEAVSAPGGPYRSMVVPFESGLGYSHYQGS